MTIREVHIMIDVNDMLKRSIYDSMSGFFTKEDGSNCTHNEAIEYLEQCRDEGKRVIPLGECDNFDYQTGCRGHVKSEN